MNRRLRLATLEPVTFPFNLLLGFCAVVAGSIGGTAVCAATINFSGVNADGYPVSGSARFTLDASANTVSVKLTNTTTPTRYAGELFTGLDFSLGGLTPNLLSDMGIHRTVQSDGSFTDTLTAKNLSWRLVPLGSGVYQLNFNPNAKDAIIGPAGPGGYSGANGSIKGNPGHNPFAAQVAEFTLSVPGLEANTHVSVSNFRFGTSLAPATGTIPEPCTVVLLVISLTSAFMLRRR